MKKVPKPDRSVPLLQADGRTISDAWDEFFTYLSRRPLSQLSDVSATAPTNGQVLVWNSTTNLYTPGSN